MDIQARMKSIMIIYEPTIGIDTYGGDDTTWAVVNSYRCRIEELKRSRQEELGRDNTDATHRIYCMPIALTDLSHDNRIVVKTKTFEIIQYENLSPIIVDSQLRHIEIYVKWMEQVPAL